LPGTGTGTGTGAAAAVHLSPCEPLRALRVDVADAERGEQRDSVLGAGDGDVEASLPAFDENRSAFTGLQVLADELVEDVIVGQKSRRSQQDV
jgi:hypothetical protein